MKKFYFTLGSGHHDTRGRSLLGWYTFIEAEDEATARKKYFDKYGDKFSFSYKDPEFQEQILKYRLQLEDFEYLDLCAQLEQKDLVKIKDLLTNALETDGAHHKQYYLEQIADILKVRHDSEGIAP